MTSSNKSTTPKNKSKLLLDSNPLIIIPELAVLIGLNESIILQQIHYWLQKSTNMIDGRVWVYNSIPQWCEQFPFLSQRSIERAIASLKNQQLILTGNYNQLKQDRTLWYTINYEVLEALQETSANPSGFSSRQNGGMDTPQEEKPANPHEFSSRQNGGMDTSNCRGHHDNLGRPLPETTTEISPETTSVSNKTYIFKENNTHTDFKCDNITPLHSQQVKREEEQKAVCEQTVSLEVLQKDIQAVIGEEINVMRLARLVHTTSLERIRYHLEHWHIHKQNQTRKGAGYFLTVIENDIPPQESEKKAYGGENKKPQRDNFDQREYTDEELERFYANLLT